MYKKNLFSGILAALLTLSFAFTACPTDGGGSPGNGGITKSCHHQEQFVG
jgi:hypothetical protein